MRIIPQHPENEPPCPQSGIAGGPIHPAHAMEVTIADRVYAVTPKDDTDEYTPTIDKMAAAGSAQRGMKLYLAEGSPIRSDPFTYYRSAYFHCLTCGFVLPAQILQRP